MATKQQTLTIVVAEGNLDPADLVRRALTGWHNQPPIPHDRPDVDVADEFDQLGIDAFVVIEED